MKRRQRQRMTVLVIRVVEQRGRKTFHIVMKVPRWETILPSSCEETERPCYMVADCMLYHIINTSTTPVSAPFFSGAFVQKLDHG